MKRPNPLSLRLRGLYVITQSPGHIPMARAALSAGCRLIQLRDPQMPSPELREIAVELRSLTRNFDALLFINDHLELAREVEADGLHLEWANFSMEHARRELGEAVLLSTGVNSVQRALAAQSAGADYIGAGPVYATQSKLDAGAPIGLAGLRAIREAVEIPVAAIGGLNKANIGKVQAPMKCVLSALANAGDEAAMEATTRRLLASLRSDEN